MHTSNTPCDAKQTYVARRALQGHLAPNLSPLSCQALHQAYTTSCCNANVAMSGPREAAAQANKTLLMRPNACPMERNPLLADTLHSQSGPAKPPTSMRLPPQRQAQSFKKILQKKRSPSETDPPTANRQASSLLCLHCFVLEDATRAR